MHFQVLFIYIYSDRVSVCACTHRLKEIKVCACTGHDLMQTQAGLYTWIHVQKHDITLLPGIYLNSWAPYMCCSDSIVTVFYREDHYTLLGARESIHTDQELIFRTFNCYLCTCIYTTHAVYMYINVH